MLLSLFDLRASEGYSMMVIIIMWPFLLLFLAITLLARLIARERTRLLWLIEGIGCLVIYWVDSCSYLI